MSKHVFKRGVKYLSVYAFSEENFKRSRDEVKFLMDLFVKGFKKDKTFFHKENIKVIFSGREDKLRKDVKQAMDEIVKLTANNNGGILNICLNYSGQREIVDATIKIGSDSIIGSGATIINNSTIGNNVTIGTNVIIDNSIIGDNCEIKSGAIVKNSIVKENSQIFESACIVHSVIGENTKVGIKSNIIDTAIESGAILGNFVNVDTASILNGAEIGKFSNIAGIGVTVVIEENAKLEAFSNVVKTDNEN